MAAFAVKHLITELGPLLSHLKDVKRTPYSFTSKDAEASAAAAGADVYAIEVRREKSVKSCWLGYRYRAQEKFSLAGGGLWKSRFKYKNSATPGDRPIGVYFETLPQITDEAFCDWLFGLTPGMAEIPAHLVDALEAIVAEPANGAKQFA